MNKLEQDAYELLKEILDYSDPDTANIVTNICLFNNERSFIYQPRFGIGRVYCYKEIETINYLTNKKIIKIEDKNKWIIHPNDPKLLSWCENLLFDGDPGASLYQPGQYSVVIDRSQALSLLKSLDSSYIKDYEYKNYELRLKTGNGMVTVLSLGISPAFRPVFETFFYLFNDTGKHEFTIDEISKKYKSLGFGEIEWNKFIFKKSGVNKYIKNPDLYQSRVVWCGGRRYSKLKGDEPTYKFYIKPFIDK